MLFRRRLKNESGYSLIEVMVSIMLLSIAIIPMAGMFDMGLTSATKGSSYDKARALANLKLEQAKSMPFATVKGSFPGGTTTYNGSGKYQSDWTQVSLYDPAVAADYPNNFRYRIEKQYMNRPTEAVPTFGLSSSPTSLIRVTVRVGWGSYNAGTDTYTKTYTTYGLVAE
jgi:prepilin-type N-terminal cleavage/methylation domain-containing protein